MEKEIYYVNYKGGINNLQVVRVVRNTGMKGLREVLKIFTSQKHLAEKRADRFIKSITN